MKRHLLILNIALLATWHTKGASTSEDSSLVAVTELAASLAPAASSQPEISDFSVGAYLDKLGIKPTVLPLSREAYCVDNHHEFNTEIGRLVHLQMECTPLTVYLFTTLPTNEEGIDPLAHQFAVAKLLMTNQFNPPAENIKSSIAYQPSTKRQSIKEVLDKTTEKNVSLFYFASLDDQPNVHQSFKGAAQPVKTASASHVWYTEFKKKQMSGEISAAPADVLNEINRRFEVPQTKLHDDRTRVLAYIRPGLQARQALIELANNPPTIPTRSTAEDACYSSSTTGSSTHATGGCLVQ